MEEKVKIFNKRLRELVHFGKLGFHDYENDVFFHAWKLKRETANKVDVISYGFSKDKWGDDMFLHPINSFIVFNEINKILINMSNHSYNFYLHDPTILEFPSFDKKNTENYYNIAKLLFIKNKIVNEEIFEDALEIFQEQLTTNVLPFFDKIKTLQQVNDEILEKYEVREWTKYISGETMFKALIILKLCNNITKYNQVSQSHKEIIANAIREGQIQYQERYNTLVELLDYLDSGKYLEII